MSGIGYLGPQPQIFQQTSFLNSYMSPEAIMLLHQSRATQNSMFGPYAGFAAPGVFGYTGGAELFGLPQQIPGLPGQIPGLSPQQSTPPDKGIDDNSFLALAMLLLSDPSILNGLTGDNKTEGKPGSTPAPAPAAPQTLDQVMEASAKKNRALDGTISQTFKKQMDELLPGKDEKTSQLKSLALILSTSEPGAATFAAKETEIRNLAKTIPGAEAKMDKLIAMIKLTSLDRAIAVVKDGQPKAEPGSVAAESLKKRLETFTQQRQEIEKNMPK